MDNEGQMSERAMVLAKKFHQEFISAILITMESEEENGVTWEELPAEHSAALVNTFWIMLQKKDIE